MTGPEQGPANLRSHALEVTGLVFDGRLRTSWGYSRGFDILGRDLVMTAAAPWPGLVFCTNIRGDWIVQDQSLRAEVRVYWLRQMFAAPSGTFCSGVNENPSATGTGGGTQMYHFIYAATALNRNGAQ